MVREWDVCQVCTLEFLVIVPGISAHHRDVCTARSERRERKVTNVAWDDDVDVLSSPAGDRLREIDIDVRVKVSTLRREIPKQVRRETNPVDGEDVIDGTEEARSGRIPLTPRDFTGEG